MTHSELTMALQILGLSNRVTLKEIRARHRQLVKQHHPDAGGGSEPDLIRRINAAYGIVSDYVTAYRYDFGEAEFFEQNPEERLRSQFSTDPIWGGR